MPRAATALASPVRRDASGLLEAVLADRDTVAARAVARLGLDARALVAAVAAACSAERGPEQGGQDWTWWAGRAEWERRAEWGRRAEDEARRRGHGYIGTEHLLLGLLHAEPVAGALRHLGSSARALRGQVHRTLCDAAPGGEWRAAGPGIELDELTEPMSAPPLGEAESSSAPALGAIAAEEPVAGLSWAGFRDGEGVLTATYGWADPLRRVPVMADTRFRAGSVTKIATALLVLRLRDRGLVDLDEPAMAKLRSVRLLDRDGAPSPATVGQLLTHTAGLPRGSGLRHYAGPVPAPGKLLAEGIRAERPAGQWSYSNLGFVALGALAADVLGRPFGACLEDWVLGPLGLTESVSLQRLPTGGLRAGEPTLGEPPGGGPPGGILVARGHAFDAGLLFPVRPSVVLALGAGRIPGKDSGCRSSTTARCAWSGTAGPSLASKRRPTPARRPGRAPPFSRTPTRAC